MEPTLLTFTAMKNEGPFIIEWVAWQRLMGIDNIVVLTNDCDDGTDAILDQLDRMGVVRHLPNPIEVLPNNLEQPIKPQVAGFAYGRKLREWKDADYVLLCDVDEFPCLRGGDASLRDLLSRLDHPDVLTMSETVFGTGDVIAFQDTPITAQFTHSSSHAPGKFRSRRGFKSIARTDPRLMIRNHRPKVSAKHAADIRWLDGSGRDFPMDLRTRLHKGADSRGMFDLVTINHYPLRSLESYMVKAARGQPMGGAVDRTYFRKRNQLRDVNSEMLEHLPRLQEEIETLRKNSKLNELHLRSVDHHRAMISRLRKTPLYRELMAMVRPEPGDE